MIGRAKIGKPNKNGSVQLEVKNAMNSDISHCTKTTILKILLALSTQG
jgi:hypothetical protein